MWSPYGREVVEVPAEDDEKLICFIDNIAELFMD